MTGLKSWNEAWTEVWSAGHSKDRSYCGIAETEDGFAVDVFHGDTCVESSMHRTLAEAERAARNFRGKYLKAMPPLGMAKTGTLGLAAQAH